MGTIAISLICHAEVGVPRDDLKVSEATVYGEWLPRFTHLLDDFEKRTGKRVPITWCCCADHSEEYVTSGKILCAQRFPDAWQALRDRGDEIGLHSHPPSEEGFEGCRTQHRFIVEDVQRMVDIGFDPPRTYVPAMMLWQDELASTLISCGFEASSTVIALGGEHLAWVQLFDYLNIPVENCLLTTYQPDSYPFRPYRVSASGMGKSGESELVELPVIGYLGKWDHPDFRASPPYDLLLPVADLEPKNAISAAYESFEASKGMRFPSLRQRWEMRTEVEFDVWPTFFHPFELNLERLERFAMFLREVETWDDVVFSTATEAAREWKRRNPINSQAKQPMEARFTSS